MPVQLSRACRLCLQWKSEILNHHRQPSSALNWGNCSPPAWRSNHWELAKVHNALSNYDIFISQISPATCPKRERFSDPCSFLVAS